MNATAASAAPIGTSARSMYGRRRPSEVGVSGTGWSRLRRVALEPERRGERQEVRQRVRDLGITPVAVEQERAHPERPGALDVVEERVADHGGGLGIHLE